MGSYLAELLNDLVVISMAINSFENMRFAGAHEVDKWKDINTLFNSCQEEFNDLNTLIISGLKELSLSAEYDTTRIQALQVYPDIQNLIRLEPHLAALARNLLKQEYGVDEPYLEFWNKALLDL